MWTLAEANVECRVISVATAAAADETRDAEKREGARGGDCNRDTAAGAECLSVKVLSERSILTMCKSGQQLAVRKQTRGG